jgi:hypothetical protein
MREGWMRLFCLWTFLVSAFFFWILFLEFYSVDSIPWNFFFRGVVSPIILRDVVRPPTVAAVMAVCEYHPSIHSSSPSSQPAVNCIPELPTLLLYRAAPFLLCNSTPRDLTSGEISQPHSPAMKGQSQGVLSFQDALHYGMISGA